MKEKQQMNIITNVLFVAMNGYMKLVIVAKAGGNSV